MSAQSGFELLMRFPMEGFSFNPENKSGMTVASNDGKRNFSIVPNCPEEDGFGSRLGVIAQITCSVVCDPDQRQFIADFINGKLTRRQGAAELPLFSHGELSVSADGDRKEGVAFWFDWFPPDIRSLVDETVTQAWADFNRLWRILRWEQKSSFRIPDRFLSAAPYWRTANEGLFYIIPEKSLVTRAHPDREMGWFGWTESEKSNFFKLWNNPTADEPLGHELQNEAEILVERAPRSALLMATAAVEAGVKNHISRAAPITDWLMQEMPSPRIGKLLRQYLPFLHEGSARLVIWNRASSLFKKFEEHIVFERNKLAHVGKRVAVDDVRSYISKTRDILYLIDYLEGHDWALEQLSSDTRKLVGLPMAPKNRRVIEISMHSGPGTGQSGGDA